MQQMMLSRLDWNGGFGSCSFAPWNERNYANRDNGRRKRECLWREIELRAARGLATFDFAADHRGH